VYTAVEYAWTEPCPQITKDIYKRARKLRRASDAVFPLLEAAQEELAYVEQVCVHMTHSAMPPVEQVCVHMIHSELACVEQVCVHMTHSAMPPVEQVCVHMTHLELAYDTLRASICRACMCAHDTLSKCLPKTDMYSTGQAP